MNKLINTTCALTIMLASMPVVAWEPTKPVEIVVAAGAGGASDPDGADDASRRSRRTS
jgi:tripartite-type tricarboxylate transporter receptor subunit TctC